MATIQSSLTSPELIFAANTAILKAQRAIAKLSMFAIDFSADAAQPGSTMMIQFFDDGEASEYDEESNNYGHADGSTSFIPVTFTNRPKKSFAFKPTDFIEVNGTKFWENSGVAAARAVERAILRTVTQYINHVNIPADPSVQDIHTDSTGRTTGTKLFFSAANEWVFGTGSFGKTDVAVGARAACEAAEIDPGECVLMLNGSKYGQVLSTLDANLYGGPEAIRNGIIEGLYGFAAVMENDQLLASDNLIGAIVPRNAIGIAGRVLPILNPRLYEEVGTVSDEKSGLTLQFRRGGAWQTDASVMTCEALFGATLLQPTKIVRIVSAAPTPAPTGETGEGPTGATGDGPTGEGPTGEGPTGATGEGNGEQQ